MPASAIPASIPFFYAALFSAFGVHMPFMPVWLAAQGLRAEEIGLCMGLPMLVRLLMPFWGFAADRLKDVRLVIMLALSGALACGVALALARGFWPILALMLAMSLFWNAVLPLTDSMALQQCAKAGADYGRVRLWGSFAFVLANLGSGLLLGLVSAQGVMPMILVFIGLALASSRLLPPDARAAAGPVRLADMARLIADPRVSLFFLAAGLTQASHGLYYGFGSVHWRAEGLSTGLIGSLWAVGVMAEVLLFAASRFFTRFAASQLVMAGAGLALLRWGVMALGPPPPVLFGLQVLHAGSFAVTHLGTMRFIGQNIAPALSATGQGLFTALSAGVLTSLSMLASGPLYAGFGGAAYLAMAGMAAFGLLLAAFSPTGPKGQGA